MSEENRRPIKARSLNIFRKIAAFLARTNITPNQISVLSIVCSLLVPLSFFYFKDSWLAYVGAILGIQLRLICNLLDGMVAIEGAKKSALGDIYNEFPDRVSDSIIILGFALPEPSLMALTWAACFLAALTAYTRVLGAAIGTKHYFTGPMAKQQRMALITLSLAAIPIMRGILSPLMIVDSVLWIITIGCVLTIIRRLQCIARELRRK